MKNIKYILLGGLFWFILPFILYIGKISDDGIGEFLKGYLSTLMLFSFCSIGIFPLIMVYLSLFTGKIILKSINSLKYSLDAKSKSKPYTQEEISLLKYINKSKKSKISDTLITKNLKSAGWSVKQINWGLNNYKNYDAD